MTAQEDVDPAATDRAAPRAAPSLSVIIPAYNEERTIGRLLDQVLDAVDDMEIIVADDGSTDATGAIVDDVARRHPDRVRTLHLAGNRGKGGAIRAALGVARGKATIIQDADLEYDPRDIPRVVAPILEGRGDVVYGSRVLRRNPRFSPVYYFGGRALSLVTNLLYGTAITDEPTCYKAFRTELLRGLGLQSDGFEFCAEVTAKVARRGHRILEVPISYAPRSFSEGKKIRFRDGVTALYVLFKHRFSD